ALFTRFPLDTEWRRARLSRTDFLRLVYCNVSGAPAFVELSGGTRRVVVAAANFDHTETPASPLIRPVVAALRAGQQHPPLIAVESRDGDLILVEGYARATAHAI